MSVNEHQVLVALRAPLASADREQLALRVVSEAARALETLAELRQRFAATDFMIDGELSMVGPSIARTMTALPQLSAAVEALGAVAEDVADTFAD